PKDRPMTQPLAGITVLDFTTLLPGPLATLMLAEAGAEVIKIERPDGEELRRHPPHIDGESAVYARVVYCAITGYGQDGPRRDEAGHDLNYIGATGLLALSPGPADHPTVPPAL